jgi:hypothetical protein
MGTPEGIEFVVWIQNPKKKSKKNCVSYLKSGKRPKICPDEIFRPDPKS